jgi:hypothetical protein
LRSPRECTELVEQSRTSTEADTAGVWRPIVETLVILPLPGPVELHGVRATARFRVDERGRVMRDSITIEGYGNHPYVRDVLRSVERTRFKPAVRAGCAVTARAMMSFSLSPRR